MSRWRRAHCGGQRVRTETAQAQWLAKDAQEGEAERRSWWQSLERKGRLGEKYLVFEVDEQLLEL